MPKFSTLAVSQYNYNSVENLESYLEHLQKRLSEATKEDDSVRFHALAYNIIAVMREIDKVKHNRETRALEFKVRDIVTHALDGELSHEDALEKLKKLV